MLANLPKNILVFVELEQVCIATVVQLELVLLEVVKLVNIGYVNY